MKRRRADDLPEVYATQRGQGGWTLSRRSLFSPAAAAGAAAKRDEAAVCGALARPYYPN